MAILQWPIWSNNTTNHVLQRPFLVAHIGPFCVWARSCSTVLSGTHVLQILEPTFPLYLSPELQNSNLTSPAAKLYLNEFLIPQIPVLRAAVQNSEVGDLLLGTANDTNSLAKAFSYKWLLQWSAGWNTVVCSDAALDCAPVLFWLDVSFPSIVVIDKYCWRDACKGKLQAPQSTARSELEWHDMMICMRDDCMHCTAACSHCKLLQHWCLDWQVCYRRFWRQWHCQWCAKQFPW